MNVWCVGSEVHMPHLLGSGWWGVSGGGGGQQAKVRQRQKCEEAGASVMAKGISAPAEAVVLMHFTTSPMY